MEFLRRCNPLLVCLTLFVMAVSLHVSARDSRFDRDSFTLDIPCLEIMRGGERAGNGIWYQTRMRFNGTVFEVSELSALEGPAECLATFDLATGELVDQVRYGDKIFDIVLQHGGNLRFAPTAISFRERGATSLWRVSDGINEVLIGGTIHVLHMDDLPLPDILLDAFYMADILVTEISQESLENEDNDAALETVINPDGRLSEILQPATYERLVNYLDRFGEDVEVIDEWRPYWAGNALLQIMQASLGYGPGVDSFFMYVANELGMTNLGLESPASQVVAVNDSTGNLTPDELILSAITTAESEEYFQVLDFLIDAWREGDIETFAEFNAQEKAANEEGYNLILRDRNLAWIPQIEEMLLTPELEIILVGVGHLAGDDNVLLLLEEMGYSVEHYR